MAVSRHFKYGVEKIASGHWGSSGKFGVPCFLKHSFNLGSLETINLLMHNVPKWSDTL